MDKDRILIGRFGAAHGVRGELRLKSFTEDPGAIVGYAPFLDAAGRAYALKALRHVKDDMFVARLEGIETRDAAEALRNLDLFVPRDRLPAPDEEEFYYTDLVGLKAFDAQDMLIGHVIGISNYGAGDILEIAPAEGGESLLLPFTKAVVPIVDVKAGRVVVVAPVEIEAAPPQQDQAS